MSQPDHRTPVEQAVGQAVDLFVYAPIGMLFEGATLLPQLVEKGRNQVSMARMIGKFAVNQGRTGATKAASKLQDQAAGVLDFLGDSVIPPPADGPEPATPPEAPRSPVKPTKATKATKRPRPSPDGGTPPVATATLAIPDYDGLSASQVVNRLAGLSPPELEAVRRYETAKRGRKTILSKVAQLQGR